ncbi:MAG: hypothetical protein A2189_08465 [Paenibacillus sp. RIFOXYA1_FULL_44_5]|nr:MAG: hypothetical protein A2189_08465 [Paenibacillus sp. RIFOXYA1_FULL_44_5]
MYYVNQEQINNVLAFIPTLSEACDELIQRTNAEQSGLIEYFAQERIIHVAIETVTDIGSLLIDGFIMRDASSYEDIIDILFDEKVITDTIYMPLKDLVSMRKSLVQQYMNVERIQLDAHLQKLPELMSMFSDSVQSFLRRELAL